MTWLTHLRTYLGYDTDELEPPDESGKEEAAQALERARAALGRAERQKVELRSTTEDLTKLRIKNHIGEAIAITMMPRKKST